MSNGQLSDATVFVIGGIISLVIIIGAVLGVFIQIKKLRDDAKADTKAKVKEATEEALKEKDSEIAFRELKKSVDNVNSTVTELTKDMRERMKNVECTGTEHVKWLARIEEVAKSAHKRIDDHRVLDHGLKEDERG